MKAIVTGEHLTTRFFLTDEGLYSDIPSRAKQFNTLHDAQIAADKENSVNRVLDWRAAYVMHNGEIAEASHCFADDLADETQYGIHTKPAGRPGRGKSNVCQSRPGIGLCDQCSRPNWPQKYVGYGHMVCLDCLA